ncbi:MAG: HD domain-containing protein, partial [Actinobacteria bacterium]|nr:HD domain-containing protein [Actinomycetota bacterium]
MPMNHNQARIPIDQLRPGDRVTQVFLIAARELRQTKAGKPYIQATLQDGSGQIKAMMWDAGQAVVADTAPETFIKAQVRVEQYQGSSQVVIESFQPIGQDQIDLADFLLHTDKDIAELWENILGHLRQVKDKALLQLLKQFIADEQLIERFKSAPAAMTMHHACVGGLIEHTESMLAAARRIMPGYPQLNADLLLTGVFLHDIGKTAELAYTTSINYTDSGQLLGHLTQGVLILQEKANSASKALGGEFPPEILNQLIHIILSHHGQHEYGSPVLPATA